jgi:hypothetical protein
MKNNIKQQIHHTLPTFVFSSRYYASEYQEDEAFKILRDPIVKKIRCENLTLLSL